MQIQTTSQTFATALALPVLMWEITCGRAVQLTDERLAHILEHAEMVELEVALRKTLEHPSLLTQSTSEPSPNSI
jgi:hypothetical protein